MDDTMELERLASEAEAGIADVLAAYEFAERHYMDVANATTPAAVIVSGSNTSAY